MIVSTSYDPIMEHMNLLRLPPNSFSLQNKRKEGNEGYMALYREGQSKVCWDKNEFIRKLEYERI